MTAALEGSEWSAACPGRTLPSGKTRYPFYRRLGGPQGRSGRAENLVLTGIRSRTVQPVAQSLYRLRYRAHILSGNVLFNCTHIFDRLWCSCLLLYVLPRWRFFRGRNMWDGTKVTNDYLVLIVQFVRLDTFAIILVICYECLWFSSFLCSRW